MRFILMCVCAACREFDLRMVVEGCDTSFVDHLSGFSLGKCGLPGLCSGDDALDQKLIRLREEQARRELGVSSHPKG